MPTDAPVSHARNRRRTRLRTGVAHGNQADKLI
jgi:hypothetical protein